jgi:hypothetical protein
MIVEPNDLDEVSVVLLVLFIFEVVLNDLLEAVDDELLLECWISLFGI